MSSANVNSIQVAPSGEMIVVRLGDPTQGNAPSNVQALLPIDDVQVLSFAGVPPGNSFTLSMAGHATAPIPIVDAPPPISATWLFSNLKPGAYDIYGWWYPSPVYSPAAVFDIFDGPAGALNASKRLASSVVDQRVSPRQDVNGIQYLTTVTVSGTSIGLRLTGPLSTDYTELIMAGIVGVAPAGSGSSGLVPQFGGDATLTGGTSAWFPQSVGNQMTYRRQGGGTADIVTADPAAIQSALAALTAIQPGGLAVTGPPTGPFLIHFTGPMAATAQPTIVPSNPSVTITHDGTAGSALGGQFPSISINGGPSILLKSALWGAGNPASPVHALPYVAYPLIQSAPSSQYFAWNVGNFSLADPYNWMTVAGGYGGFFGRYQGGGSTSATWSLQGLPPSSYDIHATWVPDPSALKSATFTVADPSGATLATVSVDQTKAPADIQDAGFGWAKLGSFASTAAVGSFGVTIAGPAGLRVGAVRLARTGPDTSTRIGIKDVVTFNAPAAFATAAAGPAPAQSSAPVANLVGGTLLPPFKASPKPMKVGWNLDNAAYFLPSSMYSNLASRGTIPAIVSDALGYPTRFSQSSESALINLAATDSGGLGRGVPNAPFGRYTLSWSGACRLELFGGGSTVITQVGSPTTDGAGGTTIYYDIEDIYKFAPTIYCRVYGTTQNPDGTWACDLGNLRIFPPDPADPTGRTPWASPPLFHPNFIAQLQGTAAIRCMNPLGTNNSNVHDFVDLPAAADFNKSGFGRGALLATVAPYDPNVDGNANGGFFDPSARLIVKITTTGPHGLYDGCLATLNGPVGVVQTTIGPVNLGGTQALTRVVDASTFLLGINLFQPNVQMTGTLNAGAGSSVGWLVGDGGGVAYTDLVALANQIGQDLWINVPHLASDACVTAMAQYAAAHLKPSLKVHVEYSNETWNFQFWQFHACVAFSQAIRAADPSIPVFNGGEPQVPYYVYRMGQVHSLFRSAFVAAGRPATDVIRTLGAQGGYDGVAVAAAAACVYFGISVDECAAAPYWNNDPAAGNATSPALQPIYDLLTRDQLLDLFELNIQYGGWEGQISSQAAALAANGLTGVPIVTYEGGQQLMIPSGATTPANDDQRSHAVVRHPRFYGIVLHALQRFSDAGCRLFVDFLLSGGLYMDNQWPAYLDNFMGTGIGDRARDRINIDDFENLPVIKSQVGGAIGYWASLSGSTAIRRKPIPGRNRMLRARGTKRA